MRFEEIMAFLAVAEHGSLTKAAESMYITQPTLSNQIAALEKELNVQLIIRHKGQRQIELTPAGKSFIGQAEKWRRLWLETQSIFTHPIQDKLRIASPHSLSYVFRDVYRRFSRRQLSCGVSVITSGSIDLYRRLDSDELDMAILCGARFYNETVSQPVAYERLVFCCGKNSDYEYLVHTKDLDVNKELYIKWNNDFHQWHSYWFSARGNPLIETEAIFQLEDSLMQDNNWAVLPISVAESPDFSSKIRICKLDNPPEDRTIYLVSKNPSKSPYYELLLNDIHTELATRNGFTIVKS